MAERYTSFAGGNGVTNGLTAHLGKMLLTAVSLAIFSAAGLSAQQPASDSCSEPAPRRLRQNSSCPHSETTGSRAQQQNERISVRRRSYLRFE